MKLEIDVPDYLPETGIRTRWDYGFEIIVEIHGDSVRLAANRAGLRSLARHLLALADENAPPGVHIHRDQYDSLEDGSIELILERL